MRALRERAKVSTDAASAWLRANRPTRDVPPLPTETLGRVLQPLWSAAVAAARDEQAEADATERAALVAAEADALTDLEAMTVRAEAADAELATMHRELAALSARLAEAEAARDEQVALVATANQDAATARTAAHAAEVAAADAQATARTLRDVLDRMTTGPEGSRATS